MKPNLIRKLKTLALICLFTSFAGVLYQLIGEQRLDFNSVLFGFPLGLGFGLLELFLFSKTQKWLRGWSFTKMLLFKALVYTAVIYLVSLSLTIAIGLSQGHKMSELPPYLASASSFVLVFYTLVVYTLLVFFLQINRLLGWYRGLPRCETEGPGVWRALSQSQVRCRRSTPGVRGLSRRSFR